MQATQAMIAGYFGGYAAKMQGVGRKQTQHMQLNLSRRAQTRAKDSREKAFRSSSQRLLKDLDGKGIIRTSVESLNLSKEADNPDVYAAECFRTFPTVTFPAGALLRREEIETGRNKSSTSVIATLHTVPRGTKGPRLYTDAPFDLLYGFRGKKFDVDLYSPFEMLRFWQVERITLPQSKHLSISEWTTAGGHYRKKQDFQERRKAIYQGSTMSL